MSDEIYHGITYGGTVGTAAADAEAITINSFSKYYSMTGWRLGMDDPAARSAAADRGAGAEPVHLAAHAVPGGLQSPHSIAARNSRPMLRATSAIGTILLDALPGAGFERFAPADGAFYSTPTCRATPTTARRSAGACWLRPVSPARRASTSIQPRGGASCARLSRHRGRDGRCCPAPEGLEEVEREALGLPPDMGMAQVYSAATLGRAANAMSSARWS